MNHLEPEDLELIFEDRDQELYESKILELYKSSVEIVERLIEHGFTDNYKNINVPEWVIFLTKIIPKIERVKGIALGKEKRDLLIMFAIYIIIMHIPVDREIKKLLIEIIKMILPELIDGIVYTSKEMGKFIVKLFNKLKKLPCCH
jgi:hypothetical protein